MPEIKTFRADSMQEALSLVRRELGPEALILHTRQVTKKGLLPWQKDKVETEIVAVADEQAVQVSGSLKPSRPAASTVSSRRPVTSGVTNSIHQPSTPVEQKPAPRSRWEAPLPTDRFETNHRFETPAAPPVRKPEAVPVTPVVDEVSTGKNIQPERESERLEILVNQRLDALQKMVEQLTKQIQLGTAPSLSPELFEVYKKLIDSEVEEELARDLMHRLKYRCSAEDDKQPQRIRQLLHGILETSIHCSGPIRVQPGQQKVVALVGPTGVGKTTTIAKLAANFRLRDQFRMGLITVDTYRIAAVEQLRTYAEIIDLPMRVVTTADEMKRAARELSQMDLILIDTAGRSPQDDLRINELKTFLNEIVIDETHLVLSATTGYRQLKKNVEKFRVVHPSSVILTKLDEAPGAGSIVNITSKLGLPISYLTTGQNVPRDIEPAEVSRATRLVLGEERIEP